MEGSTVCVQFFLHSNLSQAKRTHSYVLFTSLDDGKSEYGDTYYAFRMESSHCMSNVCK